MSTKKWLLGCGVVGSLMVLALAVVVVLASVPEVGKQGIPNTGAVYVIINKPMNGEALPLNQPVSVYVQAFGQQAIQDVQLLVDGRPLQGGIISSVDEKKKLITWSWTPLNQGSHTLVAQAAQQGGLNSVSGVVTVNVMPIDQMPLPVIIGSAAAPLVINDETGQTAQGAEPDGSPAVLPDDIDLSAFSNPPPFPPEPASQEPVVEPGPPAKSSLIPIKYSLWAQNLLGPIVPVYPPEAPTLDGGSNQCDANLMVQDNSTTEVGFNLYRLDPGMAKFMAVAVLDGQSGQTAFSYLDPGLAEGEYLYYLEAFNAAGGTFSNIIHITLSGPQCLTAKPSASQLFNKVVKIDPATVVEKAYCYSAANGNAWVRMPAGQDNFIYPQNGQIDLAPYWDLIPLPQPMPPSVTLTLDCWGWSGSVLNYLGKFSQTIESNPGPTQIPKPGSPSPTPITDTDIKVAAPFNLRFSGYGDDCKAHVPAGDKNIAQQCKDIMASNGGWLLFWDYNRYGDCNPQEKVCDASFQPSDGFYFYMMKNGQIIKGVSKIFKNYTYELPPDLSTDVVYFVKAYYFDPVSKKEILSGPSNQISFPKKYEVKIDPLAVETYRMSFYTGSPNKISKVSANEPYGLISGYAWMCKNGNPCYDAHEFSTHYYFGLVRFPVPPKIKILGAVVNWKNNWYTTSGPGANEVKANCGIRISSQIGSKSWLITNQSLWGSQKVDVAWDLVHAQQTGQQTIKFMFLGNLEKQPAIMQWDRCLWFINQLSMTVLFEEQK